MDGFERRTLAKKEQVRLAAFNLMNSPAGVEQLTMDKVAAESGIAKATIFKYFGSKKNLIQQVFLTYLDELRTESEEVLTSPLNFEERFMALAHLKVKHLEKVNQQFFVSLMDYYTENTTDEFGQLMQDYTDQSFAIMKKLFEQGRAEGKIDPKYSDDFLLVYMEAMIKGVTSPEIYHKIDIYYTEDWTEMLLKSLAPSGQAER